MVGKMTMVGVCGLLGLAMVFAGDEKKDTAALPKCPVMDEPVNLAVSTPTDEGPVFFCCDGCVEKFKKDPAKYASAAKTQRAALAGRPRVQTTCPVGGETVDGKAFLEQDGEKIHFCCQDCVAKYRENPKQYAAGLANAYTYQAMCPVMGHEIDPTSFTQLADGRRIYYCCDACGDKLFASPVKYAKALAGQGFQYNWATIKKAGVPAEGHGHDHDHDGHGHGSEHGDH